MTIVVDLEKLLEVASGFGTVPMFLTVDPSGRPRATAVAVQWDGPMARVRAGRKSAANCEARPLVSLLFPAPPGEKFALLVDGEVVGVERETEGDKPGGVVTVGVTSAMLHVVST